MRPTEPAVGLRERIQEQTERASPAGVLEQIVFEIMIHDHEHPDHGIGCACMDKHSQAIRKMLRERDMFIKMLRERPSHFQKLLLKVVCALLGTWRSRLSWRLALLPSGPGMAAAR